MAVMTASRDFDIIASAQSPGRNFPQRIGRVLWFPMFLMGLMAFGTPFALTTVRANELASDDDIVATESLRQVVASVMFIGFAAGFVAISFAIACILNEFRKGDGDVQEAPGVAVETLKMPITARPSSWW
jgi:hypothetical protein